MNTPPSDSAIRVFSGNLNVPDNTRTVANEVIHRSDDTVYLDIEDTLVEIGVLRFCGVAKKRSKNDIYRTPKIELTAADGAALAKENSHHAWVNIHSIGYPNEREMELVGEWIDMYEHVWPFTARLNLKN